MQYVCRGRAGRNSDFGEGLATCGDTLLVTDPRRGVHTPSSPPVVWRYRRASASSEWIPDGTLNVNTVTSPHWIGRDIACDSDTLALTVDAPTDLPTGRRLLTFSIVGDVFTQTNHVDLPMDYNYGAELGRHSIAVLGDRIFVGTQAQIGGANTVHVLKRTTEKWAVAQIVRGPQNPQNGSAFALNVNAVGQYMLISDHSDGPRGLQTYKRSAGTYRVHDTMGANASTFATRISVTPALLLLSARIADDSDTEIVSIFEGAVGAWNWTQNLAPVRSMDIPTNWSFGNLCLAASPTNAYIAIGDSRIRRSSGRVAIVEVYYRDPDGRFQHHHSFSPEDPALESISNCSFSSADRLLISTYHAQSDSGKVYVLKKQTLPPDQWRVESTFVRSK